jgi:hypothetical protein
MIKLRSILFNLFPLIIPGLAFSQITLPSGTGDIGAQINAAAAALPVNGGEIKVQTQSNGQCYSFTVPILITTPIILKGDGPATCLNYTGGGTAVTFSGNVGSFGVPGLRPDGFGLRDLTLQGSGVGNGQTGLAIGGPNNSVGFYGSGLTITNFGLGLQFNRGVWNFKMEHSAFWMNAQSVFWPSNDVFGGENVEFDSVTFLGSTFVNSVEFNDGATGVVSNLNNLTFVSCNFDSAQLVLNNGAGSIRLYAPHFENAGVGSGADPFVRISAFTAASDVVMDGPDFYNDQSSPYPPSFIELDGEPIVTITQMRSVNLDGTTNVPTNLLINGSAYVTLIGDALLRAAQSQYVIASGSPRIWVMGGEDANNQVTSAAPFSFSQTYGPDDQSPVVQLGGSANLPTVSFDLWTGVGSSYYGMQIRGTGPNELDFCSNGAAAIGAGTYICNAGVVNGIFKSMVPEGTPPISVASHTPPVNLNAWPATYSPSGAQIRNPHITTGNLIMPASGQVTVAFELDARFSQMPLCTVGYQTPSLQVLPRPRPRPLIAGQLGQSTALTSSAAPNEISIAGIPNVGVSFICVGN